MKLIVTTILTTIACVSGCASTSSYMVMSDKGQLIYQLSCRDDLSGCQNEASKQCGDIGYHVVESSSHRGGLLDSDSASGFSIGAFQWYNATVICNVPALSH